MTRKLSFKLGIFLFIFIFIVEAILFIFLYKSLADNRIQEVLDNLLARGNSHRNVLEKRFDESTLNHVALMESEAETIVVITDKSKNVIASSEVVTQEIDSIIHSKTSGLNRSGEVLHDQWRTDYYVATASPIFLDKQLHGYVFMLANTGVIKSVIKELTNQFILAGVIALILTIIATMILSHFITRPLIRIKEATQELMKGNMKVSLGYKRSDELGQLGNSIGILAQDFERLKEERKEFLASVSHELRTPITYIKGYANIASRKGLPEKDRTHYLNILKEESEQVTLLINNLFELAKMDQNQFVIYKEQIFLCDIFQQIQGKIEPLLRDKNISLSISCDPEISVYVDPERINQVLLNLIDNSVSHSHPLTQIDLQVKKSEFGEVLIIITDDGQGIPKEEIPYIFERLYRVDKSRSRNLGGSGLGLSIVKEIIEKHNGKVYVDSELDQGTTITIELPEGR